MSVSQKQRSHIQPSTNGSIAAAWGLFGFAILMINAIMPLSKYAVEALAMNLTAWQWILLIVNTAFMIYSEGYKGFHVSFSPRFVARAKYLQHSGSAIEKLLAPLFCMTFFNAPKRKLIATYLLSVMIVGFILLFQQIPQPWRGVLDVGVVTGISIGLISTLWHAIQVFGSRQKAYDPMLASHSN